jgi:hypothetical protein
MKKVPVVKIISLLVVILALLISGITSSKATEYDVTLGAVSSHVTHGDFNETGHEFIGIERSIDDNIDRTVGVSTFVNSYYRRSVLVTYNTYTQLYTNWRGGLHYGVVTGYAEEGCVIGGLRLCPFAGISLSYTRFDTIPRITFIGAAFTSSVSYKF